MPSASSFKAAATSAPDPYLTLQIDRRATDAEIKRAYFQLVRQFPPEREPEKFQTIRNAYERLRTPESRALVDLFLLQPPPDLPGRRRPSYDLTVHREDLFILAMETAAIPIEEDFRQ
ncbi:MAG: J domain-containing protein [Caldilineaceae bacterium]